LRESGPDVAVPAEMLYNLQRWFSILNADK